MNENRAAPSSCPLDTLRTHLSLSLSLSLYCSILAVSHSILSRLGREITSAPNPRAPKPILRLLLPSHHLFCPPPPISSRIFELSAT